MLLDRLFRPSASDSDASDSAPSTAPTAPAASSAPTPPPPRSHAQRRARAEHAGHELAAAFEKQLAALSAARAEVQRVHAEGLAALEREAVEVERSMLGAFIADAHVQLAPLVAAFTVQGDRPSVVRIGQALVVLGARERTELPPTPSRLRTTDALLHMLVDVAAERDERVLNVLAFTHYAPVIEIATRIDRVVCVALDGAALDHVVLEAHLRTFELAVSELLRSQGALAPGARERWAVVKAQDRELLEQFDREVADAVQARMLRDYRPPPRNMRADGSDADAELVRHVPLDGASTGDLIRALDVF